ncbi:hypothetical protein ABZ867_29315 [Streptomyces cinnamoneus]
MSTEEVPQWRDSTRGSMVRGAAWLLQEVGEGEKFTKAQLRAAFPELAQIDRRLRDLREFGWVIHTSREDPTLSQSEQRFVKKGLDVWDPQQRRKASSDHMVRLRHRTAGGASEVDLAGLAAQTAALPANERTRLLTWISVGERPRTPTEEIWDHYRLLSNADKQQLTLQLAQLVARDVEALGNES